MTALGSSVVHAIDGYPNRLLQSGNETRGREETQSKPPSLLSCVVGTSTQEPNRILLQGSERSGKSSLVMDMAYQTIQTAGSDRQEDDVNVVIFRSRRKQEEFPLQCQRSETATKEWDTSLLKRIEVHHVTNIDQILQYLFTCQLTQEVKLIVIDDLDLILEESKVESVVLAFPQIGELRDC